MRVLYLFFLINFLTACTSDSNYRKEEILNFVSNEFYQQYKSEILSADRMCVVIRRDANYDAFHVHHIYLWQVSFENLKLHSNAKGRVPYKIEKKDSTYFLYYDFSKPPLSFDTIPQELMEKVTEPYTLIEDEWKVYIDTISGKFSVFGRGMIDSCDMDTSKIKNHMDSAFHLNHLEYK